MEENDSINVAFYFNEEMFLSLSDQKKMDLLLLINDMVNEKMKELVLGDAPPSVDDKLIPN